MPTVGPDSNLKPTWGLALSGSGNRTSFYLGFLEILEAENLKPDFLSACSGDCLLDTEEQHALWTCSQKKEL